MILIFLVVYIVGFFVSLWVLHTYKRELGIDHYDPPHDGWYDDYDSNAEAFATFSIIWPIFWVIFFFTEVWDLVILISKKIEPKSEIQLRIEKLERYIKESSDSDPKDAYDIRAWKKEINELKKRQAQ